SGLQFEEWSPLCSSLDVVELAQALCFAQETVNATHRGAGQPEIGLYAPVHGRTRSVWLKQICIEPLECIVPVVVARNCIDRLRESLEWKIKICLVILHRTGGIDHVRGNDQKFDVVIIAQSQIA